MRAKRKSPRRHTEGSETKGRAPGTKVPVHTDAVEVEVESRVRAAVRILVAWPDDPDSLHCAARLIQQAYRWGWSR